MLSATISGIFAYRLPSNRYVAAAAANLPISNALVRVTGGVNVTNAAGATVFAAFVAHAYTGPNGKYTVTLPDGDYTGE